MESIQLIQQAICYMEQHLLEDISCYGSCKKACACQAIIFTGYSAFTAGMTASEYLRSRRLSLAGQALQTTDISVIDAAYQYGYDTPESFQRHSRVFTESPEAGEAQRRAAPSVRPPCHQNYNGRRQCYELQIERRKASGLSHGSERFK